jgi:hypothetical protein
MKRVYLLSEELQSDPSRVQLAQALTLDRGRPHMGLKGSRGLFGSPEWWESINDGAMPLRRRTGVIVRVYEAGQDNIGVHNSFDRKLEDGSIEMEGIYVNHRSDAAFFQSGSLVQVVYALDELKRANEDGSSELADIVLEMAISLKPIGTPVRDAV